MLWCTPISARRSREKKLSKIREALAAEQVASVIAGEVEIDGAYFGGYVKPANRRADRRDRRRKIHQSGKRQVVVVVALDEFDEPAEQRHTSIMTGLPAKVKLHRIW